MGRYEILIEKIVLSETVTVLRLVLFLIEDGHRSVADIAEFDVTSTDIAKGMSTHLDDKHAMGDVDFHFVHKSETDFGKAQKWQSKLKKVVDQLLRENDVH